MAKGYSERAIEQALRDAGGFKTEAAKTVGCSYRTMLRRIDKSDRLREVIDEMDAQIIEGAVSNIRDSILTSKDLKTSKWYLAFKMGRKENQVVFDQDLLRSLSPAQLDRLDAGESIFAVMKNPMLDPVKANDASDETETE